MSNSDATMRWQEKNRNRVTPDRVHGTPGGYTNHHCRCSECKAAWSKYVREARLRRMERAIPDHLHGTQNCYGNYGCRCKECTQAWTTGVKERAERRRSRNAEE